MLDEEDHLIEHYRELAALGSNFHGLTVLSNAISIKKLIDRYNTYTVLDYGSGAGLQYEPPHELHNFWGIPKPTLYDPAFPTHDAKPHMARFDGVICSDVLEHVPVSKIHEVMNDLSQYATKWVFASVCCRLSKKWFDSGLNMHCTIRAYWWWEELFYQYMKVPYMLKETP